MANDSSDLINRAAQLRHNDLTVLGGNAVFGGIMKLLKLVMETTTMILEMVTIFRKGE